MLSHVPSVACFQSILCGQEECVARCVVWESGVRETQCLWLQAMLSVEVVWPIGKGKLRSGTHMALSDAGIFYQLWLRIVLKKTPALWKWSLFGIGYMYRCLIVYMCYMLISHVINMGLIKSNLNMSVDINAIFGEQTPTCNLNGVIQQPRPQNDQHYKFHKLWITYSGIKSICTGQIQGNFLYSLRL